MTRYVLRRLLGAIPLLLGIVTLVFIAIHAAPGDPTDVLLGPRVGPDARERMRVLYGLDRPVLVQYVAWLGAFVRGDLGESFSHQAPVRDVLGAFLPNTLLLGASALTVAFVVGITIGTLQAVRRGSLFDRVTGGLLLFAYSMPSFWLALMLVLVFSLMARTAWGWPVWFPASGMLPVGYEALGGVDRVVARLRHLALPTLSLALLLAAEIARYTRSSVAGVLDEDFVRTARAKGLPEGRVVLRHALRTGLLPVVTLLGLYMPLLLSGTVFIETVFAWPGMGKAVVDAIAARDYPLVMAGSVLFAAVVVAGNLLADLLYAVVDPRVRHG